jgi:hypothetical protein
MKLRYFILTILLVLPLVGVAGCRPDDADYLSPGQVDSSLVDEVVRVRGKVTSVVENPGGLGGLRLKLSGGGGEISVRVQDDIWQAYDEEERDGFSEGKTLTVEGVLFQAGLELVVIHGKTEP